VFSNVASCAEVPDAIGWSSAYGWHGSTVIECKTSVSDFYADRKKRFRWNCAEHPSVYYPRDRMSAKEAVERGFVESEVPVMGDFRFYLCEPGIVTAEMVAAKAPCHGLIYRDGHAMRIIRPAPRREKVDREAEIRFLRFAIINQKVSWTRPQPQLLT
jgi:hypothetical protein